MKNKRIAFVTTARSDYSTMYPVMNAAKNDKDIDDYIFCGGMHLKKKFGETWQQLLDDGLHIAEKIDFFNDSASQEGLALSIAQGVSLFTKAIIKHKIDLLVVSGDRAENMALFSAATALGIPICHLCGGDITEGAFDNQIRHMMTKLSHLHMVSMPEHWRRVVQMGEEPWRVHITGDAALDTISQFKAQTRAQLAVSDAVPEHTDLLLCTFHPLTLGCEDFIAQFRSMLAFIAQRPETAVITYPNIDPGYDELIALLDAFRQQRPDAILKKSFTREAYYSMLVHAKFMVGNSSSGIWEAPSFKLPVINVGSRQAGRKRSTNVVDISGENLKEYNDAHALLESDSFLKKLALCRNPYGNGGAAEKTLELIKSVKIDDRLMVKKFYEIENIGIPVPQQGDNNG